MEGIKGTSEMALIPIFSPCAASILNLFDNQVQDVFVASAFLRMDAVSQMLFRLLKDRTTPCRLRVLTRGSFSDILAGASDVASLTLLTKASHPNLSIECRRDPRLHAKIYIVDGYKAIVTSANLTPPGLLTNIEFGMFIDSQDVVKNVLDYFDPIWMMAERFDEKVLDDLSSGIEEENGDAPSEIDREVPERPIRRRQPTKLKRSLAKLPKTEVARLNTSWDQLIELGMDVESARATMASGKLKKTLRRTVRVYDKAKQFDIGSGATISPEEVFLINNVETLKMILASPNWELRDAAAEALGNIFGDKATQVLLEALQREEDQEVIWGILISVKPRISANNLDQVLELLKREHSKGKWKHKKVVHSRNLLYLIYLIAATVNPQLYMVELIQHIPNIRDNEYIQEVEYALRGLSDNEFIQLTSSLKDWAVTSFQKVSLLAYFGRLRGDEVENQICSILFPDRLEQSSSGKPVTPMLDWVVDSLLQKSPRSHDQSDQEWNKIFRQKKTAKWLQKVLTESETHLKK